MAELDHYQLRRFSVLIRVRDNYTCYLCGKKCKKYLAHAHHVYPKSVYKEKAYSLNNGITLCGECHLKIVHTTWFSWKKFTCFFKRYIKYKRNRDFNKEHGYKVFRVRK